MKKRLVVLLCLTIALSVLSGCSKDSFMDLSGFTEYYNRVTSFEKLSIESFLFRNGTYSTVMSDSDTELLVSLETAETGKIGMIRLFMAKVDASGKEKLIKESDREFFTRRLSEIITAFTPFSIEKSEAIIDTMMLSLLSSFSSEGELTYADGDYYFVYYSTKIASTFMIYNIHVHPVEPTEKPESKPLFGNTAYTREDSTLIS